MLTKKILHLLSCTVCDEKLIEHSKGLLCESCNKIYPIEDEIIILLPEKAIDNVK
ncbi:hypothetical protein UABAM_06054 [Candidatus Uabimicrobium amorphum]|uniref:Trm112 family protein n=1 Tax=Uabimicrobium amorphum TaxID=2596890 RepID=A0A5S9F7V6_UABAM|nr:Trm112 family protein [Candidatus Uabimicrobium amorphum]BBM87642.1 hypothetical protein UABAM_06054 [Candidatus Uabimicrobium amorphum]